MTMQATPWSHLATIYLGGLIAEEMGIRERRQSIIPGLRGVFLDVAPVQILVEKEADAFIELEAPRKNEAQVHMLGHEADAVPAKGALADAGNRAEGEPPAFLPGGRELRDRLSHRLLAMI